MALGARVLENAFYLFDLKQKPPRESKTREAAGETIEKCFPKHSRMTRN